MSSVSNSYTKILNYFDIFNISDIINIYMLGFLILDISSMVYLFQQKYQVT